jgi:hypothetical protein
VTATFLLSLTPNPDKIYLLKTPLPATPTDTGAGLAVKLFLQGKSNTVKEATSLWDSHPTVAVRQLLTKTPCTKSCFLLQKRYVTFRHVHLCTCTRVAVLTHILAPSPFVFFHSDVLSYAQAPFWSRFFLNIKVIFLLCDMQKIARFASEEATAKSSVDTNFRFEHLLEFCWES